MGYMYIGESILKIKTSYCCMQRGIGESHRHENKEKKPDTKKLQKIFEKGSDGNQIDFFRKIFWIQDVGRSSLVAQWLGIRLLVQGNTSSVPSRGRSHIPQAANPGRHHCRALEPGSRNC